MSASDRFRDRLGTLVEQWESGREIEKKESKTVHDAIHGAIVIDDFLMNLVDLPPVQRLREIKQLGTAERLYPTANHARFEHTLGTFYVAKNLLNQFEKNDDVEVPETKKREVKAAAILHDIGHLPLSHTSEMFLNDMSDIDELLDDFRLEASIHEFIGYKMLELDYFERKIDDINTEWGYGLQLDRIRNMIAGYAKNPEHEFFSDVISAAIDADRIDYLLRDSYKVGFPTVVDVERLYETLTPVEDPESRPANGEAGGKRRRRLGIEQKGVMAAESLFIARDRLGPTIHDHHLSRVTENMMLREIVEAYQDDPFTLVGQTDVDLFNELEEEGTERFSRYRNRQQPKRYVFYSPTNKSTRDRVRDVSLDEQLNLEERLSERCGSEILTVITRPDRSEKSRIGDMIVADSDDEPRELVVDLSRKYKDTNESVTDLQIQLYADWQFADGGPDDEEISTIESILAQELSVDEEALETERVAKSYDGLV